MRGRVCVIAGLLALAGCGEGDTEIVMPDPTVSPTTVPASAAGGACKLLDYPLIEQFTGTRFGVSAASKHQKTQTCVVRTEEGQLPDLSLSVTSSSTDAAFAEMVPSGAKSVKGLGKTAYRVSRAPEGDRGAEAEVGWLTSDGRAICLRYTFADGEDKAAADELATKLVELAKEIEAGTKAKA